LLTLPSYGKVEQTALLSPESKKGLCNAGPFCSFMLGNILSMKVCFL